MTKWGKMTKGEYFGGEYNLHLTACLPNRGMAQPEPALSVSHGTNRRPYDIVLRSFESTGELPDDIMECWYGCRTVVSYVQVKHGYM